MCVSGSNKCSFFGKFDEIRLLETLVLKFALLRYYRRTLPIYMFVGVLATALSSVFVNTEAATRGVITKDVLKNFAIFSGKHLC